VAWDRLRFGSITVRLGGISQPASENFLDAADGARGKNEAIVQTVVRPLRFIRQPLGLLEDSEHMALQKVPRVMFSLDLAPVRRTRRKLADRLARRLSEKFGTVDVIPRTIFPMAYLKFEVGGVDFAVCISHRKAQGLGTGEWRVTIDPLDAPAPLADPSRDEQRDYARHLRMISDEIHAEVTTISGVTRLRWFFPGWDVKKPGVQTPAELPWHVSVPELCAATDLSGFPSKSFSTGHSSRLGRALVFMQRHPSSFSLVGRIIVLSRLAGAMMAGIGILLSLRFLARLAIGDALTSIWIGGLIGAVCIVVGFWAISVLMLGYRVRRATAPADRRT
jgi:hypothetical protein